MKTPFWLLALAAVAALALPAHANFEDVAVGARGIALGPSAVGLIEDASAYYWNPAALASLRRGEVLIDYAKPYGVPDLNDNGVSAAGRWRGTGWGTICACTGEGEMPSDGGVWSMCQSPFL